MNPLYQQQQDKPDPNNQRRNRVIAVQESHKGCRWKNNIKSFRCVALWGASAQGCFFWFDTCIMYTWHSSFRVLVSQKLEKRGLSQFSRIFFCFSQAWLHGSSLISAVEQEIVPTGLRPAIVETTRSLAHYSLTMMMVDLDVEQAGLIGAGKGYATAVVCRLDGSRKRCCWRLRTLESKDEGSAGTKSTPFASRYCSTMTSG